MMPKLHALPVTFWLLSLLPAETLSATFRMVAEDLTGSPHSVIPRSAASNGYVVNVRDRSERLSFPICLYRQIDAFITVAFTNDGESDDVRVEIDNVPRYRNQLTFASGTAYGNGMLWNVVKTANFSGVELNRGYTQLSIIFDSLDAYGIEIDYVEVILDDPFINHDVFRCKLMLGNEPMFSSGSVVTPGYVEQHSYSTPCPEEDNVHLAVFHDNVIQYTLTATDPLYRTFIDEKGPDTSTCRNLDTTYWRFQDIRATVAVDRVTNSSAPADNNASLTGYFLPNDVKYDAIYSVSFNVKGFKTGFIDADIHSDLRATFRRHSASSPTVKVTYQGRSGRTLVLDEFVVNDNTVKKRWSIPEMKWSEDVVNFLNISVSDSRVSMDILELRRGDMGRNTKVDIFSSDAVKLEGFRTGFWWRRPAGESLTVMVRNETFLDLFRIALYIPVPWVGSGTDSYQQIFVLYQDGNVRLVPAPSTSPKKGVQWKPFGTSVIVGKSDPSDLRPAASIRTLTFVPENLEMILTYYDGSTSKLTLSYSVSKTVLKVSDLIFSASTQRQPFATFRSMFTNFGVADSDCVQTDLEGPEHVLGAWRNLSGTDFLNFRSIQSYHLTQSPDIRLTIQRISSA